MLIMTQSAHNRIYQTVKAQLIQIAKEYLQQNQIENMDIFLSYMQNEIYALVGVRMTFADILKHIKEYQQGGSIDGNNCTQMVINGQTVMVSNTSGGIVIV